MNKITQHITEEDFLGIKDSLPFRWPFPVFHHIELRSLLPELVDPLTDLIFNLVANI